jgi:rRNA maturation protein Nop10
MERSHRLGMSDECPECGYKTSTHFDWLRTMKDIRDYGDSEKVMVFSTCPMCGSRSWAHYFKETMELLKNHPDYINKVSPVPQYL